jgi:hypothetical protein
MLLFGNGSGQRLVAEALVAEVVKRVVGNIVRADERPNLIGRPRGQGINFDAIPNLHVGQTCAAVRLVTPAPGDPPFHTTERTLHGLHPREAMKEFQITFPQLLPVLLLELLT